MHNLMRALGNNIKPAGKNKWLSKCVVHNDKDWAMSIKLNHDNSVMAHCFACGANGLDLYRHLALDIKEMYGDKADDKKDYLPYKIIDQYREDRLVVEMHKATVKRRESISLIDNRRNRLAISRIKGIENKYPDIRVMVGINVKSNYK